MSDMVCRTCQHSRHSHTHLATAFGPCDLQSCGCRAFLPATPRRETAPSKAIAWLTHTESTGESLIVIDGSVEVYRLRRGDRLPPYINPELIDLVPKPAEPPTTLSARMREAARTLIDFASHRDLIGDGVWTVEGIRDRAAELEREERQQKIVDDLARRLHDARLGLSKPSARELAEALIADGWTKS